MSLQQDIIRINGKKITINPFLYSRKFDDKTKRWLREPGQISKSRIDLHRSKFYPGLNWDNLSFNEKLLKDTTIELFLKTIEIINIFHSDLDDEQLLEIENQLIYYKKLAFEKWSRNYFLKKDRLLNKERRRIERAAFILNWKEWLSLKETQKLVIPVFVIILITALLGWFAGISKNSCNPYFENSGINQL